MKLVTFTKPCAQYGTGAGQVLGFRDDIADRLIELELAVPTGLLLTRDAEMSTDEMNLRLYDHPMAEVEPIAP